MSQLGTPVRNNLKPIPSLAAFVPINNPTYCAGLGPLGVWTHKCSVAPKLNTKSHQLVHNLAVWVAANKDPEGHPTKKRPRNTWIHMPESHHKDLNMSKPRHSSSSREQKPNRQWKEQDRGFNIAIRNTFKNLGEDIKKISSMKSTETQKVEWNYENNSRFKNRI